MDHLNWKIPEQYAETSPLLENAGYAPLLSAVLLTRGIETPEAASEYLSIGEELLCDPYLLNDMDRAVARIKLAAARREKTAVYGDYDVDGITASCLMADYLHQLGLDQLHPALGVDLTHEQRHQEQSQDDHQADDAQGPGQAVGVRHAQGAEDPVEAGHDRGDEPEERPEQEI